jgi:hypothetical protein
MENKELVKIIEKFAESGWDLIGDPSKTWLVSGGSAEATIELVKAVEQANIDCGSCGCEFDPLYKRALVLLRTVH